ncbi:toxic anion resistance protein [Peptoniphilus sp. KCTC 25270]|uniref:toxic anion resistance protein n=1 Tax=Peptoniphilus sp. KCTC 25270 TaxID=2897414 RepID=UPI001E2FCC71|nr:toxic anion resistance protein [Peptoniphilus sp. KCTC 25270]MCD1146766.1 toxic anion resistance protein [Peptoniphilus sp. KCTC 25270]
MNRLGILISDRSGFYILKKIRSKFPTMEIDGIYDPLDYFQLRDKKGLEVYYKKNKERFEKLNVSDFFWAKEGTDLGWNWESYFQETIRENPEAVAFHTGFEKREGLEAPLLYYNAMDGLIHRPFVGHIVKEYLEKWPGNEKKLILGGMGFSEIEPFLAPWREEKGIQIIDPVDFLLRDLGNKKISKGENPLRLFWLERDFSLEKEASEILEKKVLFKMYHSHPWMRGEKRKKETPLRDRWKEIRRKNRH